MENKLYVSNEIEKIKWDTIPSESRGLVKINFTFSKEWDDLVIFAEFIQNGKCYHQLVKDGECELPVEITAGWTYLTMFGNRADGTVYRPTTIPYMFEVVESMHCDDGKPPVPPTPDLYDQLLEEFTSKKFPTDTEMSDTSENAVQNKVIKGYVDTSSAITGYLSDLAIENLVENKLYYFERGCDLKYRKKPIGRVEGGSVLFLLGAKRSGRRFLYSFDGQNWQSWSYDKNLTSIPPKRYEFKKSLEVNNTDDEYPTSKAVIDYVAQHSGSTDYVDLTNKPQINGVELNGNKTTTDLGLADDGATHTTLNVEIEDDGFGGYRADYNDNDINNHRNAGGLVQAKYYDMASNQTYTYYYSTMESDRKPTFIRTYIDEQGQTVQVLASVGNDKKVTVERRVAKGGGTVDQVFNSLSENAQSGVAINAELEKKADVEGDFELIETISGDGTLLTRTEEPDGTPYAFKAMKIIIKGYSSGTEYYGTMRVKGNGLNICYGYAPKKSKLANFRMSVFQKNGYWETIFGSSEAGLYLDGTSLNGTDFNTKVSDAPRITEFRMIDFKLNNGATLEIWGVRA